MHFNIRHTTAVLLLILLASTGCKKENALSPTNKDENYLVVKDNPNDPVDHSIFQFYESTSIPCFYTDTLAKKQVGVSSSGVPQYSFQLLTLSYSPLGAAGSGVIATKTRQYIPAILDLFKTELIPKLPDSIFIPSIIFVDSFWVDFYTSFADAAAGWYSAPGFNTVAVMCRDVASMNAAEKKLYVASILSGIVAKKLISTQNTNLQKDFYSISRDLAMPELQMDVYNSYPLEFILPVVPEPEHFGFMRYDPYLLQFDDLVIVYTLTPREESDLRNFLTAALCYTTDEFDAKYAAYPPIREKFRIMREIAAGSGLQLP